MEKISKASSVLEAQQIAAPYLQDPKAIYELEEGRLNNILKQEQIKKTRTETAQIGQLTKKEREDMLQAAETAKTAIPILQDKIGLIDSLISHEGLNTRVGTTPFDRFGLTDTFTGAGADFAAGVAQLVNKETIDTLINLKARGGTLGALSDQERILLQSAATKIGSYEIKDNGIGTGFYKASEPAFKKELETIKRLAQRALTKASSDVIDSSEKSLLNSFFKSGSFSGNSSTPATINPANYF